MEIDQPSSSTSSSTTASVPAAIAASPQHISCASTVAVPSSNIQHQNGYKTMANGSMDSEGSEANSGSVMNGNVGITNASNK